VTQVAIIDGGGANIASLQFALERLGCTSVLTSDFDVIERAERVILPGVGAARDAMDKLRAQGLDKKIPELKIPLLGICLGMQLLFEHSEEDNTACLGILKGTARRFTPATGRPVPHMGWNQVSQTKATALFADIPERSYFYFVHSYAVDKGAATIGTTDYGDEFTSIASNNNFMGTQFHPERSGRFGAQLLANFLLIETTV